MTHRWQAVVIVAAVLAGTLFGTLGVAAWQGRHSGSSHRVHLARVQVLPPVTGAPAATSAKTDTLIARYERQAQTTPKSADAFTQLSLAYMQKERETTDPSYYTLADRSAAAALRLDPNNALALNAQAWVAMGQHNFVRARQISSEIIARFPSNPEAHGNLGDAEANLGHYGAMVADYQKMVDLKPSLSSYNRASYARWLYGDMRGAVRFMLLAIRAGSTQPENVAWCATQLGDDFFNDGALLSARAMYSAALKRFGRYPRALAGLGAVDAALGHPKKAEREYQRAIDIVPLPQYVIALGDLYASTGDHAGANREYALLGAINRLFKANGVRFGIEMAQFWSDHGLNLHQAVTVARHEAGIRSDITTEDVLAWTLYRSGKYADAWATEQKAMRLGTHFAPLWFHAGMIQAKMGNIVEAQGYLSKALMLNPGFSPLFAPVARAELARLNHQAAH